MFPSFFAGSTPVTTTAVFLSGSAIGVALTRLVRSRRIMPTSSFADLAAHSAAKQASAARGAPRRADSEPRYDSTIRDGSALDARLRTGRLGLPPRVVQLTRRQEPALACVDVFVDWLAELPIDEWLALGRRIMAGAGRAQQGASPHATAFAILEATIAGHHLGVAAWYVRDAVDTSAFLAGESIRRWTRTDRRTFAAAHGAAEDAALALLAREKLSAGDFTTLWAPFDDVLPVDQLAESTAASE